VSNYHNIGPEVKSLTGRRVLAVKCPLLNNYSEGENNMNEE
jgi:hypothetical protein